MQHGSRYNFLKMVVAVLLLLPDFLCLIQNCVAETNFINYSYGTEIDEEIVVDNTFVGHAFDNDGLLLC